MHEEKGHGVLLGKRYRKIIASETGEKTYRGENVSGIESGLLYKEIV